MEGKGGRRNARSMGEADKTRRKAQKDGKLETRRRRERENVRKGRRIIKKNIKVIRTRRARSRMRGRTGEGTGDPW